jgi:cell division protein FtsB
MAAKTKTRAGTRTRPGRKPAGTRSRRARRPSRLRRITAGDRIYLFALFGLLAVLITMSLGPLQIYTAAADRVDSLAAAKDQLADEVGTLEERRARLHDPEELELLARRDHGMVKPGEIPFIVITPEPDLERVGPDPARDPEPDDAWYRQLGRWLAGLFDG